MIIGGQKIGFKFGGKLLALAASVALAGCATSKERVTLLSAADGGDVGALVVEYADGKEQLLSTANSQARLRGLKAPKLKQFDTVDPFYTGLMNDLPLEFARDIFYFNTGEGELQPSELDRLQEFLTRNIQNRPGVHIEVAAHTDATGSEDINNRLSLERAAAVRSQVQQRFEAAGIDFASDDIEALAGSWHWALSELPPGEAPKSSPKYRVAVVTVR